MRIVYYPDPVLLKPAELVDELPENLDEIIDGMREVMELERGIGLAAPQVGISLQIILVGVTSDDEDDEERILINPRIVRHAGKKVWGEEGCLSFPGIYGDVLRSTDIEVAYRDVDGKEQSLLASDFLARVLQHEIDHLNGQIFVNKMRPADKIINRQKLQELKDRFEATRA